MALWESVRRKNGVYLFLLIYVYLCLYGQALTIPDFHVPVHHDLLSVLVHCATPSDTSHKSCVAECLELSDEVGESKGKK